MLGLVIVVGALSAVAAALQQPAGGSQVPRVVEVEKLKDNLYVFRGASAMPPCSLPPVA